MRFEPFLLLLPGAWSYQEHMDATQRYIASDFCNIHSWEYPQNKDAPICCSIHYTDSRVGTELSRYKLM